MSTINLPLALFTVVFRRFLDKLRVQQTALVVRNTPWFLDASLLKLGFYVYMFGTGLIYMIRHMRKGTIVSLAQKCSDGAVSIKDRCVRKKWLEREKQPWLVRNLSSNRESQQKALGYVASLLPHEMTNTCSLIIPNDPKSQCSKFHDAFDNPQPKNPFAPNPYFEPKGCFNRPVFERHLAPSPQTPNINQEVPCINISDESCGDVAPVRRTRRKRRTLPRVRNYLALRNRKIHKNELNGGEKIVRKTRSGKVYGFHTGAKSRLEK